MVGFAHGRAQREGLEADGDDQDSDRHWEVLGLVGIDQLLDALIEREEAAHAEEHQSNDERPEVAFASKTKGMVFIGFAVAARRPPRRRRAWLLVSASE